MRSLLHKWSAYANQLLALRTERGPYRFLVRRWDEISDINLALRVVETEFFEKEIAPIPLPLERFRSILVISPHQDDETIGAGGALLVAAANGAKINVLYATDGAETNPRYAPTQAEAVRIRDLEAETVCARLGATVHRLGISNTEPRPTLQDLDRLSAFIHDLKPDLIMAPWVLDSPAKHRLVNHLLWLAHQRQPLPNLEVWGFQVHNALLPNGYIDITDVAEEKRELLKCFSSQNDHAMPFDHIAMGMAAWNARYIKWTNKQHFIELFFTLPLNELLCLIEGSYFHDLAATYRGHSGVIPGATAIHQTVMQGLSKRSPSTHGEIDLGTNVLRTEQ